MATEAPWANIDFDDLGGAGATGRGFDGATARARGAEWMRSFNAGRAARSVVSPVISRIRDRQFIGDLVWGAGITAGVRIGARVAFGTVIAPEIAIGIGATTGFIREGARQYRENGRQGLTGRERFMHVDAGKLVVATGFGALGGLIGFELTNHPQELLDLSSKLGQIIHNVWGAEWVGDRLSYVGSLINHENLPNTGSNTAPEQATQPESSRIGKTYTFDNPDPDKLKVPNVNPYESSLRGKATWLSFEAQVQEYVKEKYNGVYTVNLDGGSKTFDFRAPGVINLDPQNGFDKILYDELAADNKFGDTLEKGTQAIWRQILDDTLNNLGNHPSPFHPVGPDIIMDHFFANSQERVPYRILANSEEYRKFLIGKLAALYEFRYNDNLNSLTCEELERIARKSLPTCQVQI